MADQRRHLETTVGEHVEDRFKVPLFRPANESNRVVVPCTLVLRIVPTGTVGTGDLKSELFFVEIRPRQRKPCDSNQHDAPALPTHLCSLVHGFVALGRCRYDDGIDAAAARKLHRRGKRVGPPREIHHLRAKPACELQFVALEVEPKHAAPVGTQQLNRHQSDQPESRDDNRLPQRGRGQPHALQCDGADDREGGRFVRDPLGNARAEILRHHDHLGVLAVGGDPVADTQ
jgi:hypothetical protein